YLRRSRLIREPSPSQPPGGMPVKDTRRPSAVPTETLARPSSTPSQLLTGSPFLSTTIPAAPCSISTSCRTRSCCSGVNRSSQLAARGNTCVDCIDNEEGHLPTQPDACVCAVRIPDEPRTYP